jgi:hypothetical protein
VLGFEDEETVSISVRLQKVTDEIKKIRDSLSLAKDVDPSILTDFRDAVNRVRNTAWAVEQYLNSKTIEGDPQIVLTLLAGERVRIAYKLCKLIQADLENPEIHFQTGQLLQFRNALNDLERDLGGAPGASSTAHHLS